MCFLVNEFNILIRSPTKILDTPTKVTADYVYDLTKNIVNSESMNCTFLFMFQYNAWNKHKRVMYWTARVKNPCVPITISSEHQDFRWCDLPTLLEISERENMKKSYIDCEKFLKNKLFPNETSE